jgi:hypothetical protein
VGAIPNAQSFAASLARCKSQIYNQHSPEGSLTDMIRTACLAPGPRLPSSTQLFQILLTFHCGQCGPGGDDQMLGLRSGPTSGNSGPTCLIAQHSPFPFCGQQPCALQQIAYECGMRAPHLDWATFSTLGNDSLLLLGLLWRIGADTILPPPGSYIAQS